MDKIRPEKRIKDLMVGLDDLEQIPSDRKVIEVVDLFGEKPERHWSPFVLVVDSVLGKEEIVGILSLDDVLNHMESSTEPKDELPIFWLGQFREECVAVLNRPAGHVMSPVTHVIHQNGTLTEAVHLMNSKRVNWLPVVEGEAVVGILLKDALLHEVLAVATL